MSLFVSVRNWLARNPVYPEPRAVAPERLGDVRGDVADIVRWTGREAELAAALAENASSRHDGYSTARARNGCGFPDSAIWGTVRVRRPRREIASPDGERSKDGAMADYLRFLLKKRAFSVDVRAFAKATMDWVNRRCDGVGPRFYRAAGIDKTTYSKIVSHPESYRPSKETVLRMALAFQLSLADATTYLGLAGFALSPSIPADRVWAACFERGVYRREEVESLLAELG